MNGNELYHHGIMGMKWGVRRYQNKDGSLTKDGQRRYERDQRENAGKKKGNKVTKADPHRWAKEDTERSKQVTDAAISLINNLKIINNNKIKKSSKRNNDFDLSNMTEKEMRDRINRAYLEKQYNDMFNQKQVSKGKQITNSILESAGSAAAVTSSALAIALAIKELRGS